MITAFDVYLVGICDGIRNIFLGIGILFWILFGIMFVGGIIMSDKKSKEEKILYKGAVKGVFIYFLLASFISVSYALIPSSKVAASMYIIPAIANNKDFNKLPADLLKMVESYGNTNAKS